METHDHHAPIVAAFSPETGAREPVEFGLAASRITGAPLVIVAVGDTGSPPTEALRSLERELADREVYAEVRAFEDFTAARGLARAIDEFAPELVVVGSTSRGAKGSALLGTTAERIIHVSACPVAVVPNGYRRPEAGVALIGAAYTPTPEGEAALSAAARLARVGGVRLRAITVLDPKHAEEAARGIMAEQQHELGPEVDTAARVRLDSEAGLRSELARLAEGVDAETDVLVNEPAAGLIAASANVDLLVMGSRGLGPRRAVVLGSVSRRVVDKAACPVLVIPRSATATSEELLTDAEAQGQRPR